MLSAGERARTVTAEFTRPFLAHEHLAAGLAGGVMMTIMGACKA
jgi:hypothetical protein